MKRLFAILISALMLFTCLTVPVSAERAEANIKDAASLDEALNIPGGSLSFSTDTQYPWVVDGDAAKSSNEGVASSTSSVWINFTASAGDVIQFDWISMGEGSDAQDWDGLRVYLDGTKILHKSAGHPDWEHYQQEVAAGEHELKFTYKKDSSIDKEGDCAKIDNVHVGAPILPTSIEVQPVTVIAGRSERAEFTVNPSYAYDKSVTYATADESIATVNANGGVFGVSAGTTTLTVTSVANPSVSGTATVTVLPSTGAAQLFGFCLDDVNEGALNGNLVSFFSDAPSVITTETYFEKTTYSSAFAGGNIYGYVYDSNGSDTRFFVMNAETFEVTYPGTSYPAGMLAMAYNHANGTMYGISAHRNNNKLVSIDIATGYVTEIATITGLSDTPMTLAIDLQGNAYTLEENSSSAGLYRLDLETGAASFIGSTGASLAYMQSMTYDFASNKIYWAQTYDVDKTGLYTIDPVTMEVTGLGRIGAAGMELTGLFIKNNLPVDVTPNEVTVTFYDNVGAQVVETRTVPSGTVLDPSTFPTAPTHPGFTFLTWNYTAGTPIYRDTTITTRYYDPNATTAVIVLNVPEDHWGDGSGYQMLIDADATAYGVQIPENSSVFYPGNAPASLYEVFEYKIPENADGSLNTQNMVVQNSVSIEIPAGTYDWCIVNPSPGDKIYIATSYGNTPGKANDFTFEAGKTYTFTVTLDGNSDRVDLAVTLGGTTPQQPQGMLGDTDLNGSVTIADAVLALRHALGLITLEGQALINGDVDGNGGLAVADAVQILRKAMGLIDSF